MELGQIAEPSRGRDARRSGALLRVDDLTVRYGGLAAVDGVSLEVEQGHLVGLIGPNGAGKTTFIDAVTGITRSTGSILFAGEALERERPYARIRRGLARTFQSLELFEDLTVRENLLVAAERPRWWSTVSDLFVPAESRAGGRAADSALELLGLRDQADALPGDVSLGVRKLITVARALAAEPRLVMLDEPAAGLDSNESIELGARLRDVVASGVTVLLVDHDMGLVLGTCDRINVLEFGRLIASGSPAEVRDNQRVIDAYLGGGGDDAEPERAADRGAR
jgi:ABC-type branched-subunit amino acid transport system ATPase component